MGFQIARMTSRLVVMAMGKDSFLKEEIRGYIYMIFVGEDPLSILPVRETEAEGRRNGSIHRLECLENEGVRGGGGLDTIGERSVNEVDKE